MAVEDLVNDSINLLKNNLIGQEITCKIIIQPKSLKVHLDRSMFEQIFINIIKNAVQAMEEIDDPILAIRAFKKEDKVYFQIQDNVSSFQSILG